MPSSMIFTGLVLVWLIVLVPTVARHRQEVARPSVASLSGRVLSRPQRRPTAEVETMQVDTETAGGAGLAEETVHVPAAREPRDDEPVDDRDWESPAPRYRPGRGGFDPEAARLAARARYAVRQRVVLGLLVAAVVSGVVAAVVLRAVWWAHGAVDLALVGYLIYLRRQVRLEEAIRERRAARLTGVHHGQADEDHDGADAAYHSEGSGWYDDGLDDGDLADAGDADLDPDAPLVSDDEGEPERIAGTGEPVGPLRPLPVADDEPALPRLEPAPMPPLPAGTALVEADDADIALADLDVPHRRAVGE